MKVIKLLFIFLFCPSILLGQNLIPNGSFEDTATRITPLYLPSSWYAATNEGFEYLTPLNNLTPQHLLFSAPKNLVGYQVAKSGTSYLGFLVYDLHSKRRNPRREYAQVRFTKTLQQDSLYCLQLFLSLADSSRFASKGQMGVYFSNQTTTLNTTEHLPVIPQIIISPSNYVIDKINWQEFNFQYKASGGERYITLGNFNDTTFIDTLSVGGGDSNNLNFLNTYYYLDDIWLSHCDSLPDTTIGIVEQDLSKQLLFYPNPSKDFLNIELRDKTIQVYEIQVLNLIGQKQRIEVIETHQHKRVLEIANLKLGVYLLQIISDKGVLVRKFVKD